MWTKLVNILHKREGQKDIVKVHCNLQFLDKIEEIGHSDANVDIEWSSAEHSDWRSLTFELFELWRTLLFLGLFATFSNFIFSSQNSKIMD